jgi:hypothetical protein
MQVVSIDKRERRFAVSKDPLDGTFRAIDDGLMFERVFTKATRKGRKP